ADAPGEHGDLAWHHERVRRPPAAGQDHDRGGRVAVRADAVRLAVLGGPGRVAGDLDDRPDRPAADQVDAAGLHRRTAAGAGRAGTGAEPDGDTRHFRYVLGAGGVRAAGDRPGPDQGPGGG